jgi:two-component system sensor kinase FixL
MPKSEHPKKKADAGKTKQQLVDELNALRRGLPIDNDLQNELVELRRSEKLLASILDISSDAIISIDENQCITRFNKGAEHTFGYSTREILGQSLETLLPKRFRGKHRKHVEGYRGSAGASRLMNERSEISGLRKNGTTFPGRASISRVEQDGKVTLTVFLRDITDFNRMQDDFQRSREELAHVARVGLLGEISASLAHELNQPLAAILTNAQALKRQLHLALDSPEGADEVISDVIDDTRRAADVIQRLRALLKPGKGTLECIDLNTIIAEAVDLLGSEMVMRRTQLTMELEPDLPIVSVDRVQVQQILLNLLSNSIDAMDEIDPADRHVLIRTSRAGSDQVEVCVKDSGAGFKADTLPRLFEPFYTTKEQGMGMGLAISKTILQSHGGQISAENNRGPGARFFFTLPMVDVPAAADVLRREQEQADRATVFIVDDDPSVLKAMGRLIGAAGYAVETFASAEAFLQHEHLDGPGCLVADLHMPEKTGLDLQTTLNARDYTMPIIFITGAGNTSTGVLAMKQGAVDFLSKPVDDEELLSVIARAVNEDKQARAQHTLHTVAKERLAKLTAREVEILNLVVEGKRNKQIAHTLGITEKTVKAHRGHIMEKVEAATVADLVRISEIAAASP